MRESNASAKVKLKLKLNYIRMNSPSQSTLTSPWPRVIQSAWFARRPYGYLDHCVQRYGQQFYMTLSRPFGRMLVVSEPKAVRQVFQASTNVLCGGTAYDGIFPFLSDRALVRLRGDQHQAAKREALPIFSTELVDSFSESFVDYIQREFDQAVDTPTDIRRVVARVVARWATLQTFGVPLPEDDFEQFEPQVAALFGPGNSTLDVLRFGRSLRPATHMARQRDLFAGLQEVVGRNRSSAGADSVAEKLDPMRDSNPEINRQLTEFWAFLYGAQYSSIMHVVYQLLTQPTECQRMQEMIVSSDPSAAKHIRGFNDEVRRLTPDLVGSLRGVREPVTLAGESLRPGDFVMASCYLAHRRKEAFAEPLSFRSERFLHRTFSPNEYFPFGGGSKKCLGRQVAIRTADTVVRTLLERYRFAKVNNRQNPVMLGTGGVSVRSQPVHCRVKRLN